MPNYFNFRKTFMNIYYQKINVVVYNLNLFFRINLINSELPICQRTCVDKSTFVEVNGVEPMTLCVQGRCSSQLSYTPNYVYNQCELNNRLIRSTDLVVPPRVELGTSTLSV